MRRVLPIGMLVLAACGGPGGESPTGAPVERTLTEAAIDSLPELAVTDGPLLCTSLGYDDCPLHAAVANRVGAERIAIWEPGRTVRIWAPGDSLALATALGHVGGDSSTYRVAAAVARDGQGYQLVAADSGWRVLRFDGTGTLRGSEPIVVNEPMTAIGFVGNQAVRQVIRGWQGDSAGALTVTLLDRVTDTTGTDVLRLPIPWMQRGGPMAPPLVPLIAASPSWGLLPGGDVVWSPGSAFEITRQGRGGTVRWTLHGPAGPPVTARDLDIRDSIFTATPTPVPFGEDDLASMRERSDSVHPAISGLTTTPTGEVIVARSLLPGRDSVAYLRLDADGVPVARFTLPETTTVLLAEGDSLLVHRPTESDPWQLLWLRLVKP